MITKPNDHVQWNNNSSGGQTHLTKREYFAALAMQGLCADPNSELTAKVVAEQSVKYADALINELNKEQC